MKKTKLHFLFGLSLLFFAGLFNPSYAFTEIELRVRSEMSTQPLTTEKIWKLDPYEANPHRRVWILERSLELEGLQAVEEPKKKGVFGVQVQMIKGLNTSWVRPEGVWYSSPESFECEKEPNSWFANLEGSKASAEWASQRWSDYLKTAKLKLSLKFSQIKATSPEQALAEGRQFFKDWLIDLESDWISNIRPSARKEEWKNYLATFKERCSEYKSSHKALNSTQNNSWVSRMEPPLRNSPLGAPLTRAPSKVWGGLYTVRVSALFGDKSLNGRFLIDSGSSVSTVSPHWLKAQGINPLLVQILGAAPQKVNWSGGVAFAQRAKAMQVSIANFNLPLTEFLLMDSQLFDAPSYLGSCCDGVLGTDFLRQYAVEFSRGPQASVTLRNRESFGLDPQNYIWIEVAQSSKGDWVSSDCILETDEPKKLRLDPIGLKWDTGSEWSLELAPYFKSALASYQKKSQLKCHGQLIAESAPIRLEEEELHSTLRGPAINIGMELLGRGDFAFDLGHGRIWLSRKSLTEHVPQNITGVEVDYTYNGDEDRTLRVNSIDPKGPAGRLIALGLKKGVEIVKLDGLSALDIDLWEVEQRFAGVYGSELKIQWRGKDGDHLASIPVRKQ